MTSQLWTRASGCEEVARAVAVLLTTPGISRRAGSEALVQNSEVLNQKLWQALTALPIGPPEALRTSSLMSVN